MTYLYHSKAVLLLLGICVFPLVAAVEASGSGTLIHYPGNDNEVPPAAIHAPSGTVHTEGSVKMLTKPGTSIEICQTLCHAEKHFTCTFFRLLNSGKTCLLLSSKLPKKTETGSETTTGSTNRKEDEEEYEDEGEEEEEDYREGAEGDEEEEEEEAVKEVEGAEKEAEGEEISHLKNEVEDTKEKTREEHEEIEEIVNNQKEQNETLVDLSNQVSNISNKETKIENSVSEIADKTESAEAKLDRLGIKEGKIEKALISLAKTMSQIQADVTAVKITNEELTKQMEGSETNSPIVDREIKSVKRDMADIKSQIEMNPTVFKITKNQRVLAEALESIDRELTVFERKLSHIDETSDELGGRLSKEELHRRTLNGALQTLTNAVRDIRTDINKIQSPMSSDNVERKNKMQSMRSDINVLGRSNRKMTHDMHTVRSEMSGLLKDMMTLGQGNQQSKTSITALVEAARNMKQDYQQLRQEQDQMTSKIKTLATVYKSVVTALHNLEIKQIQSMHQMQHYKQIIQKLDADFLDAKKVSGQRSDAAAMISRNLTQYSNLLMSQKNLYNQLMNLKSQMNDLQAQVNGDEPEDEDESDRPVTEPPPQATTLASGKLNLRTKMRGIHQLQSEVEEANNEQNQQRLSHYQNADTYNHDSDSNHYRGLHITSNVKHAKLNPTNILNNLGIGEAVKKGKDNKSFNVQLNGKHATVEENTPYEDQGEEDY